MSIIKEFKEFAVKGDAVDMAVGLVIGASFSKIVTSLVSDVIMPPIGLMLGGVDFKNLKVILKAATLDKPAVTLNYGAFINTAIDFLIVAFCIFLLIRAYQKLEKKKEEVPAAPPAPSKQESLLEEIRDLLKKQ